MDLAPNAHNLTGQRFGNLEVLQPALRKKTPHGQQHWHVLCICGNRFVTSAGNLRAGRSTQCTSCRGRIATWRRYHQAKGIPRPILIDANKHKGARITPELVEKYPSIRRFLDPDDVRVIAREMVDDQAIFERLVRDVIVSEFHEDRAGATGQRPMPSEEQVGGMDGIRAIFGLRN